MELKIGISLLCIVHQITCVQIGMMSTVDRTADVRLAREIGMQSDIHAYVVLRSGVSIGMQNTIGARTTIGERSIIQMSCDIGKSVTIGKDVRIGMTTTIQNDVSIGDESAIDMTSDIGEQTVIENNVRIAMTNTIGSNVSIGKRTTIQQTCVIRRRTVIHNNVAIGMTCAINEDVTIGNGSSIGMSNTIGNGVIIKNNVKLGMTNSIGDGCSIGDGTIIGMSNLLKSQVVLGNNVNIGMSVEIAKRCIINDNCKLRMGVEFLTPFTTIGTGSILNDNAEVYSSIGEYVYVGKMVGIAPKAEIGNNAVLHTRASIPANAKVRPNDVIIPNPTSYDLYAECLPLDHSLETESKGKGEEKADYHAEFQDLRPLINEQINRFKYRNFTDFKILKRIKTLYLIRIHGQDDFMNNYETISRQSSTHSPGSSGGNIQASNVESVRDRMQARLSSWFNIGNVSSSGNFVNRGRVKFGSSNNRNDSPLKREIHFKPEDKRMKDEVKNELKKLLAIEHDSRRLNEDRVSTNDNIATMANDIITGRRKVKFDSELFSADTPIDPPPYSEKDDLKKNAS